jgi:hypothetical protein
VGVPHTQGGKGVANETAEGVHIKEILVMQDIAASKQVAISLEILNPEMATCLLAARSLPRPLTQALR